MQIFPEEYKPYIKRGHVWATALSGVLIVFGLLGIILLTIPSDATFLRSLRKFIGGLIIFGIPSGLIIISVVISFISRSYNKARRDTIKQRSAVFSAINRTELIKTIVNRRYDYHNAEKTWLQLSAIMVILSTTTTLVFYIFDPNPIHGRFVTLTILCGSLIYTSLGWSVLIKPKRSDFIELTEEGIQYRSKGDKSLLPWHQAQEIQATRGGYIVKADDRNLIIWSDIEPADMSSSPFFQRLIKKGTYVQELLQSIKTLAPHIFQKEAFLGRDAKLPISNKVINSFIVILIFIFLLVIIKVIANNI